MAREFISKGLPSQRSGFTAFARDGPEGPTFNPGLKTHEEILVDLKGLFTVFNPKIHDLKLLHKKSEKIFYVNSDSFRARSASFARNTLFHQGQKGSIKEVVGGGDVKSEASGGVSAALVSDDSTVEVEFRDPMIVDCGCGEDEYLFFLGHVHPGFMQKPLQVTGETVTDLFLMADLYEVEKLKAECVEFWINLMQTQCQTSGGQEARSTLELIWDIASAHDLNILCRHVLAALAPLSLDILESWHGILGTDRWLAELYRERERQLGQRSHDLFVEWQKEPSREWSKACQGCNRKIACGNRCATEEGCDLNVVTLDPRPCAKCGEPTMMGVSCFCYTPNEN